MESTLKNMVLVLFIITLVASTAVGIVYRVTLDPIAAAKSAKTAAALALVMPKGEVSNEPAEDKKTIDIDGVTVVIYTAKNGADAVGYAVETATKSGFSGEFKLMVGFKPNGDIVNIEVLQHNETPGLGSKMTEPANKLIVSFEGKNPAELKMSVRKDGGDIDALTASTITSRAYVDAVQRAYDALQQIIKEGAKND